MRELYKFFGVWAECGAVALCKHNEHNIVEIDQCVHAAAEAAVGLELTAYIRRVFQHLLNLKYHNNFMI